ncbi:MAG: zinc-binding dehydrogenase [Methanomassiliicoccales archaeon]
MVAEMDVVAFREKGGVDKLRMEKMPVPEPGDDEVLLNVLATSVNHLDITTRNGTARVELSLPHIPGCDAVGTIAGKGKHVVDFEIGETVVVNPGISCGRCRMCTTGRGSLCESFYILGEHVNGACAEYVTIPSRNLKRVPRGFPFIIAAAAPLVYLTAWHALVVRAGIRFGEDVFVSGASGGVSTAAIQVAKLFGGRVVGGTRSNEKVSRIMATGADEVVLTSEQDWSKSYIKEHGGFDIVVDGTGAATWRDNLRLLRKGGRIVNYGITGGSSTTLELSHLFWKQQQIVGSTMGDVSDFETVMDLVFSGRLKPVVDRVYSLRDTPAAQDYVERAKQVGKVVIVNGETDTGARFLHSSDKT